MQELVMFLCNVVTCVGVPKTLVNEIEKTFGKQYSELRREHGFGTEIFVAGIALLVLSMLVGVVFDDRAPYEPKLVHEDGSPLTKTEIAAFEASPDKYTTYERSNQKGTPVVFSEATICSVGVAKHLGLNSLPVHTGRSGSYQTYQSASGYEYGCRVKGSNLSFIWKVGGNFKYGRATYSVQDRRITISDDMGARAWIIKD